MKTPWIIFSVSVVLNLVLVAALIRRDTGARPDTNPAPAPVKQHVVTRKVVDRSQEIVEMEQPALRLKLDWRQIESEDFREYVANLRAAGAPEQVICDIIIAEINKHFSARWRAMVAPNSDQYWAAWDPNAEYRDPRLRADKRLLEVERVAIVRELLGVEYDREMRKQALNWTWLDREDNFLAFLPKEKADAARELKDACRRLTHEVEARAVNGKMSEADQNEYNRLRKEETAGLKALLTPEEFQQYMMRMSATATRVRSSTLGFDMQPNEFDAIVAAEFWFQGKSGPEAEQERDQKISSKMGDARFAEYLKAKDRDYQELMRFALQTEIPRDAVSKVYEIKKATDAQLRNLAGLPAEERAAATLEIQTTAAKAVSAAFGPSYDSYVRTRGRWLGPVARTQGVAPRPAAVISR